MLNEPPRHEYLITQEILLQLNHFHVSLSFKIVDHPIGMLRHKIDQWAIHDHVTWTVQSNLADSPGLNSHWLNPCSFQISLARCSQFTILIGRRPCASVNIFYPKPILVTLFSPANQQAVFIPPDPNYRIKCHCRQWNTQAVSHAGLLVNFACRTTGFSCLFIGPNPVIWLLICAVIGGLAAQAQLWLVLQEIVHL